MSFVVMRMSVIRADHTSRVLPNVLCPNECDSRDTEAHWWLSHYRGRGVMLSAKQESLSRHPRRVFHVLNLRTMKQMKHLRYSIFCNVMQRGLVISYRHFETPCRSSLKDQAVCTLVKTFVLRKIVGRNVGKRSCWRRTRDIWNILQSRYFPNVILQLWCCVIGASYFISKPVQRNLLQPYIGTLRNT